MGNFPKAWKAEPLRSIVDVDRRVLDPRDFPSELFQYHSIPAFQEFGAPIREKGENIRSGKLVVVPGTILFGRLNPRVPKVWMVEDNPGLRQIASTEFIPLIPKDDLLDGEYLFYLCWSSYLMGAAQNLVTGSTPSRERVDPSSFLELIVPIPPLPEQRAIARVLSTVRRAQQATREVVEAAREAMNSAIVRFFEPEQARDKYSPKEQWPRVRLEELGDYINGYAFKPSDWGTEGLPIIRIQNLNDPTKPYNYYSGTVDERYRVRPGDILVSWSASLGVFMWLDGEAWLNQHIFKAVVNGGKVDREYFFWAMKHEIDRIATLAHGSTMHHVTRRVFLNSTIPRPPPDEQRRVASTLSAFQHKIDAEENRVQELAALYQTCLQGLLSGTIRIPGRGVEVHA